MTPADWLEARGAHHDVVTWARPFPDFAVLWDACPRGDWLLGIAVARGVDAAEIERAMLAVATLALDHLGDEERTVLARLLAAPPDERRLAAPQVEADGSTSQDPALGAARTAIGIALAARVEDAAAVPSLVASAAVFDAGDCAMMPALSYAQRRSAELVREVIPTVA